MQRKTRASSAFRDRILSQVSKYNKLYFISTKIYIQTDEEPTPCELSMMFPFNRHLRLPSHQH
jgi:hypothetical protein